jgi:tripartite-type tricarboxylate transporter receptor subunit TctC
LRCGKSTFSCHCGWVGRKFIVAHPSRRHIIKGLLTVGIATPAILRAGTAFAAYPERPVRIIVANTPGGPSDIIARIMAAALQETIGGAMFVENRGGAGGNIGMGLAARAEPDGYTFLLSTSAYSVNPGLYEKLPYDPFKDFVAICELAISPHVFAIKPDLGPKTMKEFVALAKATPEKFNVSTPPIGTTPQLQAEVLKLREGLQRMAPVVFPGGGDALKALLSGTVQLSSGTLAPVHQHIKSARSVARRHHHQALARPASRMLRAPELCIRHHTALMAPARTPPEIVARIEKETLAILRRPEMLAAPAVSFVAARVAKEHMERVTKGVAMFRDIIEKAGVQAVRLKQDAAPELEQPIAVPGDTWVEPDE